MRLTITPTVAIAWATAALTALGLAAQAAADPATLGGTYAIEGGADGFYFVATPNCTAGGCTADLVGNRGWSGVAALTDGRWNFAITQPDGAVCADGSYESIVLDYSVDAASLDGILTTDSNGNCPGGQIAQTPFRLRKIADR